MPKPKIITVRTRDTTSVQPVPSHQRRYGVFC